MRNNVGGYHLWMVGRLQISCVRISVGHQFLATFTGDMEKVFT